MKHRPHPEAGATWRHPGLDLNKNLGRPARWAVVVGSLAALLVAGCSSTRVDGLAPVEDRLAAGSAAARGSTSATAASGVGSGGGAAVSETQIASVDLGALGAQGGGKAGGSIDAAPVAQRVVYFDFDSFVVKDEYRPVVDFAARYLNADRQRRVLVEGHTDDRGGREYNLALGQKRADAVVRALQLLGAQDAQMEAVSYGEERPAAPGSSEAAWAKNRRAELKDR
ncbi:peptidoglycan-associated lipoprotein Pal [Sphaerotilus microaerophilus]|jgi:peptidoglycan-associated lipoprotein|uniref:Peptidoglycan-associated protein n=1 Tax=Sphaerotilus microaerophilus TaxID=2914710 RepID=A0ABN6PQR4_9BURK|nr:peptidoglycan-associated lipoprotein Pal [Sphaerotilus sp. FB-5]BDI05456.1 hypothetical protein CATMQ487_24260 [Sphaerotilus sp. FB-5]